MARFSATGTGRPTRGDRAALNVLLGDYGISNNTAQFLESLAEWEGDWTERQVQVFDEIWERTASGSVEMDEDDGEI